VNSIQRALTAASLVGAAAASLPASAAAVLIPNGTGQPDCGATCVVNMTYRGGPVMTGTTNAYIIWYGDWSSPSYNVAQTLLPQFFSSLTGSEYMNIGMTYDDGHGTLASSAVHFGGAVSTATTVTSGTLSNADILNTVLAAQPSLNGGVADPNGIYFVYTAPGISQQQSGSACGWHSNSGATKYSWVTPTPGCDFLPGTVTGNDYVDSLTETTSHEMFEAITDPNVGTNNLGWYNTRYGEVGDMCVNSNLDANLNGNHFDVQAIWARVAGAAQKGVCAAGFRPDVSPVPEPASWALMLGGVAAVAGLARRRAQR
jgi:hypothetical protein